MPQLNCEACSERKVRCDKQSPCSTCKAAGVVCVPVHRRRLPRGRHVNSSSAENKELRERLARLEGLIATRDAAATANNDPKSISIAPTIANPDPGPLSATTGAPLMNSNNECPFLSPGLTSPAPSASSTSVVKSKRPVSPPRYIANGFWNDLVDKVCPKLPCGTPHLTLTPSPPESGSPRRTIRSIIRRGSLRRQYR